MNILREKQRLLPMGGYMGGGDSGGGGAPATQTQVSDIPDWAKPYAQETLARGKTLALDPNPYQRYTGQRTADFTPLQQQAFQGISGLQTPWQTAAGSTMAAQAAQNALNTNYGQGQFYNQYQAPQQYQAQRFYNQFQAPQNYQASNFQANQAQAPELQQYQMGPAQQVSADTFNAPGTAAQYMNPYTQNVVDVQQREAQRQSDIASQAQNAQAARAGAFGGGRDAVMRAEAARNLATQKGAIQATGQQQAFQNAQQQFNAEQNARMQAALANQGAGLTVGQQNLAAQLGVQQLGAGQNLQAQLANQQAGLNAQQMAEQSRQFGAGQGLTAAQLMAQYGLSAQQAQEASRQFGATQGMTNAQNAAQYGQAAQQLAEQSRQYGAGLGLQGLQTALTGAGQLGTLGQNQYNQQTGIYGLQNQYGTQQQQQQQNILNQQYQDFLNQQKYPYQQLEFMSSLIRGTPMGTVNTMYAAPPSAASQAAGLGLAAYGASRMADGGEVEDASYRDKPAGLADLAIARMA